MADDLNLKIPGGCGAQVCYIASIGLAALVIYKTGTKELWWLVPVILGGIVVALTTKSEIIKQIAQWAPLQKRLIFRQQKELPMEKPHNTDEDESK